MSGAPTSFNLRFSVAGMSTCLVIDGLPVKKKVLLKDWYSAFQIQAGDSSAGQIRAWVEAGGNFMPFEPGPWQIRTARHGERIEFQSYQEQGWYDLAKRRGELVLRPGGNPENYLRVIYAWRCLEREALLVHASGVIRRGRGFVFFGPSGSGKTTTARLSREAQILSDDLVILQREVTSEGAAVRVFGVPFRGEMVEAERTNASAPLAGLYSLTKAQEHRLADLAHMEGAARLVACVPFVMSQPENARRVLALCAEITRLVRVKQLHFKPDAGFWQVIDG
jgi:hypothetical protein